MVQYCTSIGYSPELTEDAQKIVDLISHQGTLVGCQPLTLVGVALYMLNQRIDSTVKGSENYK